MAPVPFVADHSQESVGERSPRYDADAVEVAVEYLLPPRSNKKRHPASSPAPLHDRATNACYARSRNSSPFSPSTHSRTPIFRTISSTGVLVSKGNRRHLSERVVDGTGYRRTRESGLVDVPH
jgi:hypothetical protein